MNDFFSFLLLLNLLFFAFVFLVCSMDIPLCSHGGSTETSIFHSIVLVCTLDDPNVFLKPQRIAMYGISCIGFIGCESDQNTDRTAHSAAFTDWMRNMQLLMIIQGNFLIVQMCS